MSRTRVTLDQLASEVGLARTTVSDIINRDVAGRYSEATRKRVRDAMRRLGYTPARAAQQLARGRSGQLGLILTRDFSNPFFARAAHFAQKSVRKLGYRLQIVINPEADPVLEAKQIEQLKGDGVEGIVVGPVYELIDLDLHQSIFRGQVPIVTFGGAIESTFDEVIIDNAGARQLAIEHLHSLGHERIGFLCAPPRRSDDRRTNSVEIELNAVGIQSTDIAWQQDTGRYEDFHEACDLFAAKWKQQTPDRRVSAVLCLNDQVALTALSAFARHGIDVPKDLSVIGNDNLPESGFFQPALTTIDIRLEQVISTSIDLLNQRIEDPSRDRVVEKVEANLVQRRSTAQVGEQRTV